MLDNSHGASSGGGGQTATMVAKSGNFMRASMISQSLSKYVAAVVFNAAICGLLLTQAARAADAERPEGISTRAVQQDAIRRIPMQQLNAAAQNKITTVVEHSTMFRRSPTKAISCDPDMFLFLVRYPEVMVNIWDVMGITKVAVKRTAPFVFTGNDGVGTQCSSELLYGTPDLHIYYSEGLYDGNMLPRKVTGKAICILRNVVGQDASGDPLVVGQLDIFLKLDNLGIDLIARTMSPLVAKTADHNFVETAQFLGQISEVSERNPAAMQQMAARLNNVDPAVRDQFSQLILQCNQRAEQRMMADPMAVGGRNVVPDRNTEPEVPSPLWEAANKLVAPNKTELIMQR